MDDGDVMADQSITASMLYSHAQCPHRVALDRCGDPRARDPVSPFVELLWARGNAFEREVVDGLDLRVVDLKTGTAREREAGTLSAMRAGVPLVYGGRMVVDDLVGEPDLLRKQGSGYAPGDIKSGSGLEPGEAGKPKVHYAVQLALYVDILQRLGLADGRAAFVWDVGGHEVAYDLEQKRGPRSPTLWETYERVLAEVRAVVGAEQETTPALCAACKLCHWRTHCRAQLEEADDLTLIAELGRGRRDKLAPHVPTVRALAETELDTLVDGNKSAIKGVGLDTLRRFQTRARLQKEPNAQPVLRKAHALPPDDLELFFDVETDPMRGVCYLHGVVERRGSDPASETYVSFFADEPTPEAERDAFAAVWAYLHERPFSALYVYSAYEKATLKGLAARHPDVAREDEVAALFERDDVVDLYFDLVKAKMEWPTSDLSVKTLATFWGFSWRDPEPSGAASIQWYHEWVVGDDADVKRRILEYNEDDCRAMRVLVDGVRALAKS